GSCFGVTPSISLRPSGHTMMRSKVIFVLSPPSDSGIASVDGRRGVLVAPGKRLGSIRLVLDLLRGDALDLSMTVGPDDDTLKGDFFLHAAARFRHRERRRQDFSEQSSVSAAIFPSKRLQISCQSISTHLIADLFASQQYGFLQCDSDFALA